MGLGRRSRKILIELNRSYLKMHDWHIIRKIKERWLQEMQAKPDSE